MNKVDKQLLGDKMFRTRYRVIRCPFGYDKYVAQYRHWWSPVWLDCFGDNGTVATIEEADKIVMAHKSPIVKVYSE